MGLFLDSSHKLIFFWSWQCEVHVRLLVTHAMVEIEERESTLENSYFFLQKTFKLDMLIEHAIFTLFIKMIHNLFTAIGIINVHTGQITKVNVIWILVGAAPYYPQLPINIVIITLIYEQT